ncbi:hypothetical protein OEB94_03135 [Streptomyces sp. ICN988]|uniref:hypothetical protein n=1 Tax=Streptomyces sp. ICN988 TaxID=2983765 RepID=UPI0021E47207|nr:hypothetical protein [Streptomyces sp. ICN988]MCV2458279.1 hypothetical protein [Streptomyces sp. ICN988]
MSQHDAIKLGPDVLSPVAPGQGQVTQTAGEAPVASKGCPRLSRTPHPAKRQSRVGELRAVRLQFYRKVVETRDLRKGDQPLRLLAYSLVPSPGARPDEDWGTLQTEAEQHGYAIGARLHDVAVPVPATRIPASRASRSVYTPPWQRPGWREAERQLRDGLAEGVIVLDRHNISSDDDEYHAVLVHLSEQCGAFLHLVIPEEPSAPT